MGNRGVIRTKRKDLQVYLHWDGSMYQVKAVLDYCRAKRYPSPEQDSYGWARLCQVFGNYIGRTRSLGIDRYTTESLAEYDNGNYIIEDWRIVGREDAPSEEDYSFERYVWALEEINDKMPERERLTREQLDEVIKEASEE